MSRDGSRDGSRVRYCNQLRLISKRCVNDFSRKVDRLS